MDIVAAAKVDIAAARGGKVVAKREEMAEAVAKRGDMVAAKVDIVAAEEDGEGNRVRV